MSRNFPTPDTHVRKPGTQRPYSDVCRCTALCAAWGSPHVPSRPISGWAHIMHHGRDPPPDPPFRRSSTGRESALQLVFVLCLSGKESVKAGYAMSSNRLCFADISLGPGRRRPAGDPRLFLNYNWREYEIGRGTTFRRLRGRPYMLRAYNLRRDPALGSWDGAERAGVNIMATDWLRRLSVGPEPFARI